MNVPYLPFCQKQVKTLVHQPERVHSIRRDEPTGI